MADCTYYRPIQYLGSKIRAINSIVHESTRLYTQGEYVVDLFSGSSIVSQALYKNGMNVIANDAMSFCSDISSCMLNQDREKKSEHYAKCFLSKEENFNSSMEGFVRYVNAETRLLNSKDIVGLKALYDELPQIGKNGSSNQIKYIRNHLGEEAFNNFPLVANYYAGTYFGIKQSLQIDAIRKSIEQEWLSCGDIWEKKLLLTALYSTCSIIVHSVGKHFAQPMLISEKDINKVTSVRLFENRKRDVISVFKECCEKMLAFLGPLPQPSRSFSMNMDVDSIEFYKGMGNRKISLFYADPPYTAQQYSRFYHIPEVLRSYKYPQLQMFRGQVTQGLYPQDRFKSNFCSKSEVEIAFQNLFNMAKNKNAHLILSYSASKTKETGNERMISLDEILNIGKSVVPEYSVKQYDFDFEYRQLNCRKNVVEHKNDKELLIVFER